MKRQKYKCKNIHEYKRLRRCSYDGCTEVGIVTYHNVPKGNNVPTVIHRCCAHVHQPKEVEAVAIARNPNLYHKMEDVDKWLSLGIYWTTSK